MGRKVKILKNFTSEQVEALIASDAKYKRGIQLYAILHLSRGMSSRKLTEFYPVSFKQICNWADRFDAEGIDGLGMKKGRGRHAFLSEEQKYELQGDLLQTPEAFGYNTANWSGPLLIDHIAKKYRVTYGKAAIYPLMHSLGFSFQRTRASYPERDEIKRKVIKEDIKKNSRMSSQ